MEEVFERHKLKNLISNRYFNNISPSQMYEMNHINLNSIEKAKVMNRLMKFSNNDHYTTKLSLKPKSIDKYLPKPSYTPSVGK